MKFLAILVLALATASAYETPVPFRDTLEVGSESRIIGGKTASTGQFPYQVGLNLNGAWCGGSLISSTYVMTAAHCVYGNSVGGTAYLGAVARTAGTARKFTAKDIIQHASYISALIRNDIALIRIDAVALSSTINVIRLPAKANSYSTYAGVTATLSGWGKTSDTSGVASTLMYANAKVIPNAQCADYFGSLSVSANNVCIETVDGSSTCNGDSGGPLVYGGEQIGITSYGSSSGCTKGYPAAFTRVTSFREWITANSGV